MFGAFYFAQGVGEPTQGLVAQPARWLLKSQGHDVSEIALFSAVLSLPWTIKPLYGLISDFVPLWGSRRRSWLILCSLVASLGMLVVWAAPGAQSYLPLLLLLLPPSLAIAFCDVVIDALMVETAQPRGLTGRFQSVQWTSIQVASIGAGLAGGWLAQEGRPELGFLICGVTMSATVALAIFVVRDPARVHPSAATRPPIGALWRGVRHPAIVAVGAFLLLWSFNPFSSTVLYLYMTQELELSEQLHGNSVALFSLAAAIASALYGFYCRRVPFRALVHASIALGVASTLAYWTLEGPRSALAVAAAVGFAYMTATLIQLDLAARLCPPAMAGTVFATLMALSNLGVALSTALGGWLYEGLRERLGAHAAFDGLVAVGALCTAASWLLVPLLQRHAAAAFQPAPPSRQIS
jgi:MFS family permease